MANLLTKGELFGIDIVPTMIDFCQKEMAYISKRDVYTECKC